MLSVPRAQISVRVMNYQLPTQKEGGLPSLSSVWKIWAILCRWSRLAKWQESRSKVISWYSFHRGVEWARGTYVPCYPWGFHSGIACLCSSPRPISMFVRLTRMKIFGFCFNQVTISLEAHRNLHAVSCNLVTWEKKKDQSQQEAYQSFFFFFSSKPLWTAKLTATWLKQEFSL